MRDGRYSYRFEGYAMEKGQTHTIVGVGSIKIANMKVIRGDHRASLARMTGSGSTLIHSHFSLAGSARFVAEEQSWDVELVFEELTAPANRGAQTVNGSFRAVEAGPDRYWIISTGAISTMDGVQDEANEVVSGELVWLG
ncbi:hypothetical protein Q9K01_15140 [Qipengyuania sp. DY56-A-20]|jgi:hypothetical protein|uniref:Uncharacterized protein n=1 Tax=Qipengyuania benthica TaxID=3067651 RepID=A0ABT9HCA8_9SPHN|nr:hypothetical protein [Qipengyuania sp. DY56-A-20]MDP4540962.1 hypothetical protein [Qipengyuania sp. DY56-A-20]